MLKNKDLAEMVPALLAWFDANARILPWRENSDPYRVWVSEIMLQQTRVETVKPYFDRFMRALPEVQSLAAAPLDQVLKLWEGLGYYSRARNLHRAAQVIVEQHGGVFPQTPEEIQALPGVGDYTAGAIGSICFGLKTPAVDGNVLRVMARLTGFTEPVQTQAAKKHFTCLLAEIYPENRADAVTQSLMELGAMVCVPNGAPRCGECPVRHLCEAYHIEKTTEIPVKLPKKPRRKEQKTVFLLYCRGKLALCRRAESGLLGGLWELPNTAEFLSPAQARDWLIVQGLRCISIKAGRTGKHIFTHIEWEMQSFVCECAEESSAFFWADEQDLQQNLTLPTAFQILLQ